MLKFYHIETKLKPDEIKISKKIKKYGLVFLKKSNPSYNMAVNISVFDGGFRQVEICIPKKLYTTSLHPTEKNRILKVTKENFKEYKELMAKYPIKKELYNELSKNNIIGIDATDIMVFGKIDGGGVLWKMPPEIIIGKTEKMLVKVKTTKVKA